MTSFPLYEKKDIYVKEPLRALPLSEKKTPNKEPMTSFPLYEKKDIKVKESLRALPLSEKKNT